MSLREFLNDKKIIFCGPLFNKDDEFLSEYDVVIRTNNFFSIEPELRNSSRCDILVCNSIFSKRYSDKIVENIDEVKYVFCSSLEGAKILKEKLYSNDIKKVHFFSGGNDLRIIKRHPLGLMHLLSYIINFYKPSLFYIDGIDFYSTKNVSKFWLKGYEIKESATCNVLGKDKIKHDLRSNKEYLKRIMGKIDYIQISEMVEEALKVDMEPIIKKNKPKPKPKPEPKPEPETKSKPKKKKPLPKFKIFD